MRLGLIIGLVLGFSSLQAAELNGVTLADSVKVGEADLVLNGIGLRKVTRFGIPIKVYVGGLYLEEKSKDSKAIIDSDKTRQIVMEFVRPVDRKSLVNGYKEGYEKNCQVECDKKGLFTEFKNLVVSMRKGNRTILTFEKDKVTVENTGPNAKKGVLESATLSKNILAIFINEKAPPTKEFRRSLLGLD